MSTLTEPEEQFTAEGFRRKLGLFDATTLVAGTMIGSGIFIVSSDIARDVGTPGWLMVVWILTAVMTIIGALSYAELAAMMPHAGGQYVYLRESYSPLWGFLYGWTCFLVIQTGSIAAVGVAFAKFLGVLVPELGTENVLYEHHFSPAVQDSLHIAYHVPWLGEEVTFFERSNFSINAGQLVAVAVIMFLSLLNCRGVEEGKWVQNLFTVAKTLALIVLIVLGLTIAANPEAIRANTSDWWQGITHSDRFVKVSRLVPDSAGLAVLMVLGGAMVGSLFAADAWNNITFTAGEIRNPRRNLPLSLLLGTGLVMVLYLLANLAYLAALPVRGDRAFLARIESQRKLADEFEKAGLADQAETARRQLQEMLDTASPIAFGIDHARDQRVGTAALQLASPRFGVPFMAIAIMISTFGCINGMILMGARLYYAMSQDGLFFQSVGQLNQRGVPAAGLILQGIWSCVLVFSGTYNELLDYIIFAVLLFYVLTVVGLFVLRWTQPTVERPYRAFGYPVIPAIYLLLCTAIMLDLLIVRPVYTWPGLLIVLTGIPVYFVWRSIGRRAEPQPAVGERPFLRIRP